MPQKNQTASDGRLLVLLPGVGAVATTLIAGVELVRRGLGKPIGSWTQLGHFHDGDGKLGKPVAAALPIATLDQLAFAGWDMHGEDALTVAQRSAVLEARDLTPIREPLKAIKPMPAVHDPATVRRLEARPVVKATHRREQADTLRDNIRGALKSA